MNSKNKKILDDIFADPIKSDIKWIDIESLFLALGADITEGNGSRVRVKLGQTKAVFHRPHPKPETNKATIKDVKLLLNAFFKESK